LGDFTVDELICSCIARQLSDDEVVAQGIATPLVVAGYLLAKHAHAPHLQFASAISNTAVFATQVDFVSGLGHSPHRLEMVSSVRRKKILRRILATEGCLESIHVPG